MKGDFSRSSFDPTKNFSSVLMQQGRVTLDADFNEQGAIFLHALRTLTRDLFGPSGGPVDQSGFELMLGPAGATSQLTLSIGAGHYYVDGILCECGGIAYDKQDDYTPASGDLLSGWLKSPVAGKFYWLYLDVWERHISWAEDDSIRDVALGGPDTCTRSQVVWQVKALEFTSEPTCGGPLDGLPGLSAAALAARLDPGAQLPDPCALAPDAKYRGAENQLYRVEIHQGGTLAGGGQPNFKWSRDNGSVVVPWLDTDGTDLIVTRTRGFDAGVWVELSDDSNDLNGTPGQLVKLVKVQGDRLSFDPATTLRARDDTRHPRVRRWDQVDSDAIALVGGAMPIIETPGGTGPDVDWTLRLEDGIEIVFSPGGTYRTGDYWLIPARVATGTIEWPTTHVPGQADVPAAQPPLGIQHHYAPLGVASFSAGTKDGAKIDNCRRCLAPLGVVQCPTNKVPQAVVPPGVAVPATPLNTLTPAVALKPPATHAARKTLAKTPKGR